MDSWTAPVLPEIPGTGPRLALYDSSRQGVFPSGDELSARRTMYVCGITPYDATHLGHAATMIAFDLINRVWRDNGLEVSYVQNVTDVDDPLLERAKRDGSDWVVLAMRETALFREDMESLRILPPEHYVGAIESIPGIAERVAELLERGIAYRLDDGSGDIYFDLTAAPRFGYESNLDRAEMLILSAERGGDPQRAGKRDPLDPLLWRGARADEPSWEADVVGRGRPGWHIECAVIALELLGDVIDVQGGGSDLMYPHHECSSAHAEVLTGVEPFARHYTHAGMIGLHGEKMSKSKGNLVFVSRLRGDGIDPMAVRLGLISSHYRADRQWTDDILEAGRKRLATWRDAVAAPFGPAGVDLVDALRQALADDLDTVRALSLVDNWSQAALTGHGDDAAAPALVANAVDALLGVRLAPEH